ncbi:hypothetical protein QJS04_geneDACA002486 [Acorus gramineus]|uniref:Protein kinase domain-containing protein n=1 Tax=Acorus gramineus TaxID=55184 RepID=A0AAV8ZVR0_ACOGR|nr:hypothetical protein QJS04_geneDACA002486 [Acorus gramineus]
MVFVPSNSRVSEYAMAQSTLTGRARDVGDYIFGRQIGSRSFSVVWHARHRVRETEFTVKEIVMEKLGKKLQNSLLSEIYILKKINQPNIIRLHAMIEMKQDKFKCM